MCGIVGYVGNESLEFEQMLNTLTHRGPDSSGLSIESVLEKQVMLGHVRLSIIDLSENGKQPMSLEDGMYTIIYNGEVYNFKDLRKKYLADEQFFSETDTEVILRLYRKLGTKAFAELNGDFAIAILDRRLSQLILTRDRLGVKPLYLSTLNNQLLFASEIKSILRSNLKWKVDNESLQKYFLYKYVPGNRTLFKDIDRLKPGHFLVYNIADSSYKESSYWSIENVEPFQGDYKRAQTELKELIADAVGLRLIADVPLGTFLSGGIDSSIIASHLKGQTAIQHYCAVKSAEDLKNEGSTSDAHYAQKLANAWNLQLATINIGSSEATLDLIRTTLQYNDDLIADGSQIPSYLITKAAAPTSRVILSGMGADEIFLGYAGHQITLLSQYFKSLPKPLRNGLAAFLSNLNQGKGRMLAYRRYLHKFGKYANSPDKRLLAFNIVGDLNNSLSIFNSQADLIQDFNNRYIQGKNDFENLERFERENFLVKNLHYLDRMAMANGVEGRVPFMDHRIVEFAHSLPRSFKIGPLGRTKKILKDAYADVLPDYIIHRRKAGFGMPLRSILSDQNKLDALIHFDFFNEVEQFDIESIRNICRTHVNGEEDNSALIYALISYQEWHKIYLQ